jgi:hypothetical protein
MSAEAEVIGDRPVLRDPDGKPIVMGILYNEVRLADERYARQVADERGLAGEDLLRQAAHDLGSTYHHEGRMGRTLAFRDLRERYRPDFIALPTGYFTNTTGDTELVVLVPKETA